MNHQFDVLPDEHNQLEQVAVAAGSGEQIPRRVVSELDPDETVPEGVLDVVVPDAMSPCRPVDLHMD